MELTGDLPFLSFAAEPAPGSLAVPLPRIIEEAAGFLYYGGPRSGKSHAVRQFLEETHGRIQHIVFDSEGEFYTLREAFPYLLAATGGEGDIPLSVATAGVLCARVMELGVSLICDLSGLSIEERPAYVAAFLTQLLETPKEWWHPVVVVVDEVHRFAPQDGATVSKSLLANLPAIGRKRGFIAFYATQNIEQVDKGVIAYLPNKLVGKITMDNRRKRAADDFGLSNADRERLKSMKRGQFFGQGIFGDGETVLLQVPDTLTHAAQVGTSGWKTAPPVPDAIKELLAHFAALPDEAAAEVKNLEDAKTRIAELEKQLAAKETGGAAPATKIEYRDRVVEKLVEVHVEVPVISEEALQRAEAIQRSLAENAAQLRDEGQERLAMAKDAMNSANELGILLAQHRKEGIKPVVTSPTVTPSKPKETAPAPSRENSSRLAAGARKMLEAFRGHKDKRLSVANIGALAGLKWRKSGTFSGYLRDHLDAGRLIKEGTLYRITDAGLAALGIDPNAAPPPNQTTEEIVEGWRGALKPRSFEMLQKLVAAYPNPVPDAELAGAMNLTAGAGTFGAYKNELTVNGLAEASRQGLTAGSALFPDGRQLRTVAATDAGGVAPGKG